MAHAYLIKTNNIEKCEQSLLKVIKNFFCSEEYTDNCKKCSLCHLIDINSLPNLQVISPDGNFIKKDQVLNLKKMFVQSSQIIDKKVYIIKECERMNKESANTMLKFLEEPVQNVIGFFLTSHIENVLATIQSRCQVLEINFDNEIYENCGISKSLYFDYLQIINTYLLDIEVDKKYSILINKICFYSIEKEKIRIILQIILDIYNSLLNDTNKFDTNYSDFSFLKKLSLTNIVQKINLIIEFLNEINYNVNVDLLLDRFVIEMDGINHEVI